MSITKELAKIITIPYLWMFEQDEYKELLNSYIEMSKAISPIISSVKLTYQPLDELHSVLEIYRENPVSQTNKKLDALYESVDLLLELQED